jgi:5'(3')-deoxyribonucleotidase
MSEKLKVYLDLDETISDLSTPWIKWLNETRGLSLTLSDFKTYDFHTLHIDPCADDFWKMPGIYTDKIRPFDWAPEFVNDLRKLYDVRIITASEDELIEEKDAYILKYFGIDKHDVIHSHDKYHHTRDGILVDDYLKNIRYHVYHNHQPGILFNWIYTRPWASYNHKGVRTELHRFAATWSEVKMELEYFQEKLNGNG